MSSSGKMFLNFIAVYVKSGSKSVLTYAFMEQGSIISLCADCPLGHLGRYGGADKVFFLHG